jgi:hypothetical protein
MPRRRRNARSLPVQLTELAFSVPQVVTHRLGRIARAGPVPSSGDRSEIYRMTSEKVTAFYESWTAMQIESMRLSQELWLSSLQAAWTPWLSRSGRKRKLSRGAASIAAHGLSPISRRASANARRLAKRKLR